MPTGRKVARRFLTGLVRDEFPRLSLIPKEYRPYNSHELYNRFLISEDELKGQVSSLYGESGRQFTGSLNIDFGVLLAPVIPVASIRLDVTGSALRGDEFMIVLHRPVPLKLRKSNDARVRIRWRTTTPVALMLMQGTNQEGSLTIRLDVGASVSVPFSSHSGAALGIRADLLQANAAFTTKTVNGRETNPGWYSNLLDENLQKDFTQLLGSEGKRELKREIAYLLAHLRNKLREAPQDDPNVQNLLGKLRQLPWAGTRRRPRFKIMAKRLRERQNPFRHPATVDILDQLDDIIRNILGNLITSPFIAEIPDLENTLRWYREKLAIFKAPQADGLVASIPAKLGQRENQPVHLQYLCYTNLSITTRGGGVFAGLTIELTPGDIEALNLGTPDTPNFQTATIDMVGGKIGYQLDGDIRIANSRFQTYGLDDETNRPLLLTQDVQINYSLIKIDRTNAISLGLILTQLEASADQTVYHRMNLDYHSVTAYWRYPPRPSATNIRSKLRAGSGLAHGISVGSRELVELAIALNQDQELDKKQKKLKQQVAERLKIGQGKLVEFLIALADRSDTEELRSIENNYEMIILEANFRFTESVMMSLVEQTIPHTNEDGSTEDVSLHKMPSLLPHFLANDGLGKDTPRELESLRLRLRKEDHIDNEDSVFRLGGFFLQTGASFDISNVQRAGNAGIIDFFNYPFRIDDIDLSISEFYERAVPSTYLLPHVFHIS